MADCARDRGRLRAAHDVIVNVSPVSGFAAEADAAGAANTAIAAGAGIGANPLRRGSKR